MPSIPLLLARLSGVGLLLACSPPVVAQQLAPYFSGERILIDARLKGKPARFVLDTGAELTGIFQAAADRLEIETEKTREIKIAGRPIQMGMSEKIEISLFGGTSETNLNILPMKVRQHDGVLGWRHLASRFLLIDGYDRIVANRRKAPERGWQKWELDRETGQLFFQVTDGGKPLGRVFVDTGAATGLRLSPALWQRWRDEHPEAPTTLETFRYTVGKATVSEVGWAEEFRLGDLVFHHVDLGVIPGATEERAIDAKGKEFVAMIGIRAMRHLRMVICRESGELFTQSVSPVANHNRLGAVFLPGAEGNPALVARVLEGGLAARAGMRSGDVLAEINGIDFRPERDDPSRRPDAVLQLPAGSKLQVQLLREGKVREFSVVFQDVLGAGKK